MTHVMCLPHTMNTINHVFDSQKLLINSKGLLNVKCNCAMAAFARKPAKSHAIFQAP